MSMEKGDTLTQNREEDKPVELRVLRYFLAVVRMQSISAAAEELHITQPTLSRQLMELEEELGAKLFDRGRKNRRVALTEAGKRLHRQAEEIVALADKTLRSFQAPQEEISGEIAIGGGETDAMRLVARAARALTREHPNIRYHLYSGNAEDVTERLDKGLLDFGILIEPVSLERYDYIQLPAADTWGLLMRRDHPLARKRDLTVEDLYDYPQIRTTSKMAEFCNYDATLPFDVYGSVEKNVFTNNRCTLYDMLAATDAVFLGIKSQYVTEFHPGLETRPLPGDDREWSVYYVKLKSTPLQPYAQRFLQILKELAQAENSNE